MTIAWSTVQSAIRAWVRTGSGLADGAVIWARQPGPRPTPPYITIGIGALAQIGQDVKLVENAASPAPGAEIAVKLRGTRQLAINLTCFDAPAVGVAGGVAILDTVRASQRLPTPHSALRAAGVGIAKFGPVLPIDTGQVGAARFEPRAIMEVRAFVSSEVAELTTYIERAVITDLTRGRTFTVDISP